MAQKAVVMAEQTGPLLEYERAEESSVSICRCQVWERLVSAEIPRHGGVLGAKFTASCFVKRWGLWRVHWQGRDSRCFCQLGFVRRDGQNRHNRWNFGNDHGTWEECRLLQCREIGDSRDEARNMLCKRKKFKFEERINKWRLISAGCNPSETEHDRMAR